MTLSSVMCLLLISFVNDDSDSNKRTIRLMREEKLQKIHSVPMYMKLLSSNFYVMWVIHVSEPSSYMKSILLSENPI
jgi:hypothetical protein